MSRVITLGRRLFALFIAIGLVGMSGSGRAAGSETAISWNATTGTATMSRNGEITMALNAAPKELRNGAGVYIFGATGFVRVRASTNGFNCLVERGRFVIGPVCYDAEGSRTTLQASLEQGRLRARGYTDNQAAKIIDSDYRSGRFKAPSRAGLAYMLSNDLIAYDAKTATTRMLYPPHIMIYAPYVTNDDIGVSKAFVRNFSHVWVEMPGRPDSYIIVPAAGVK